MVSAATVLPFLARRLIVESPSAPEEQACGVYFADGTSILSTVDTL